MKSLIYYILKLVLIMKRPYRDAVKSRYVLELITLLKTRIIRLPTLKYKW